MFEEVAVDVHENRCHFKDDMFDDLQDILLEFVCLVLENRVRAHVSLVATSLAFMEAHSLINSCLPAFGVQHV